jgi:hypothetical protein
MHVYLPPTHQILDGQTNLYETWCIYIYIYTSDRRTLRQLLVTANVVPSSPTLVTLMKEALSSSETSVLTRATRRNISEDTILHSHYCENLKSYKVTLLYRKALNATSIVSLTASCYPVPF